MMTEEERSEHLTNEVVKEQQAKVILNGVKDIINQYRGELFNSLTQTKWMQRGKREEIYRQLKSVDTFEARLLKDIQTGKIARQQLSLLSKAKNVVGLT